MAIKINNYLKNLGKSIVYAAVDDYTKTTAIGEFIGDESNQELAKTIYHGIRDYKTTLKRAAEAITTSKVYITADSGFKYALEDLKTGNFYNKARQEKLMDQSFNAEMGFDEFNFDEDFSDTNDSKPKISDDTLSTVNAIKSTAEISTNAIAGAVVRSGKYNADVTKQSTALIISQQAKFFGDLKNGVLNTNNTLTNLVNFNDKVMTTHIENSRKFFDETTKLARENNAILKELLDMERVRFKEEQAIRDRDNKRNASGKKNSLYDILSSNGVVDLRDYFDIVKKNFADNIDNLGLGMFKDQSIEDLKMMVANPLGGLVKMFISSVIGPNIKKVHRSLDKTFGSSFANLIAELNYKGKNTTNPFLSALAKVFGVDVKEKNKINTSNYEKGPVPFDGKTRKSIIEVIPTYLSHISAALTGSEPIYYDFDAGKWTSYSKVKTDFGKNLKSVKESATREIEESVRNAMASIKSVNEDVKKSLLRNIKDYAYNNDTLSGFENEAIMSDDEKKLYEKISRKIDKRNVSLNTLYAKNSLRNALDSKEKSGDSILNLLFNDYDKKFNTKKLDGKASIFGRAVDEYGFDNLFYLQNIYNELFWIRKYGANVGGKKSIKYRGGKNDIDAPPGLNEKYLEAKKRKEEEEKAAKAAQANNQSNENSDEPNLSSDKYKAEYDMERMSDSEKSVRAIGKEFKNSKFDALTSLATMAVKDPRKLITGSLAIADRSLYDLFFEHKYKDKDGREISGFFDLLAFKLENTFTEVKNFISDKVISPAWKWIKSTAGDFSEALFGKNFFAGVKDEAKSQVKSDASRLGSRVTKAAKNIRDAAANSDVAKSAQEKINAIKADAEALDGESGKHYNGARLITSDGLTTISKGEAIIPADMNPYNPDMGKTSRSDDRRREDKIRDAFFDNLIDRNADGNISIGTAAGLKARGYANKVVNNLKKILGDRFGAESVNADFENFSQNSTRTKARGFLGGAAGGAAGGIFFGPVGLLVGALAGGVVNILRDSETAKDILLGKKDEDKNRTGGIISKNLQDKIKKYAPDLFDIGLPAAAASGLLMGFGPLGMAVIGSGAVIAKNSKGIRETLFGKEFEVTDKDGTKRTVEIDGIFSRKLQRHIKKHVPGIAAATLSTAVFGPFGGLLSNMVLGAGIGIIGTSTKFQELILGYKDPRDPEGKKRRGGLVGALKSGFINPLIKVGKFLSGTFIDYMKDSLLIPIAKWSGVVGRELLHQSKNLSTILHQGIGYVLERLVGTSLYTKLNSLIDPYKQMAKQKFADFKNSKAGKLIGTVGKIGKTIIDIPRISGKFLSNLADISRMGQYGRGAVGMTTATQRLSDANTVGMEYKTMGFDQYLAGLSDDELDEFKNKFYIMGGKTTSKAAYRDARQTFSTQMSRYFRNTENNLIKTLQKRFEEGDLTPKQIRRQVDIIAKDKSLNDKEKQALLKILYKYGKDIETARKAANGDEELAAKYKKEMIEKFGTEGYDFNSATGIASALNSIQNESMSHDDAAYKKQAQEEIEKSKKVQEDQLGAINVIKNYTASIGTMLAKRFGFDQTVFAADSNAGSQNNSSNSNNNQTDANANSQDNNSNNNQTGANNSQSNSNTTQTDQNGRKLIETTDGSLEAERSEKNADIDRAEAEKEKKQNGIFDKLKGLFSNVKEKGKEVVKSEGGFLHNMADTILGKGGALASMLKTSAMAALVGPLVIKAIPVFTKFLSDHKEEIISGGKAILSTFLDIAKDAGKAALSGIYESFSNGDFASGLLRIIATAVIGNKMLGGLPVTLGKGAFKLGKKAYQLFKGGKTIADAASVAGVAGDAVKATKTIKVAEDAAGVVGNAAKATKAVEVAGDAAKAAGAADDAVKVAGGVTSAGGILSKLGGIKLGTKGKVALAAAAAYGAYKLFSSSTEKNVQANGGLQPGQLFTVDKNGQLVQLDENGNPIIKKDDKQKEESGGVLPNLLDTADSVFTGYSLVKTAKNFLTGGKKLKDGATVAEGIVKAGGAADKAVKGTSALSKLTNFTSKVSTKVSAVSTFAEKAEGALGRLVPGGKGLTGKGITFIKDLVVAGTRKLTTIFPKLGKVLPPNAIEKLGETFVGHLVKNGYKYLAKLTPQITAAMTGVGAVAVAVANAYFAFDSIYNQGWRQWYNNAEVLYNEDLGDDVKYLSVLSGVISALLFSVIPVKFIFKILASCVGIDLSAAQQRAQYAIDAYNADKKNHPKGAPARVKDIEEYNALYEKGLLESVKETGETLLTFGKNTLTKMNQAAKYIGTYIGDKAKAAKNWAKNNAKWLAEAGMNWFKQKFNSASTFVGNTVKKVKDFASEKINSIITRFDNASKAYTKDGVTAAVTAFFTDPASNKAETPNSKKRGLWYTKNNVDYLIEQNKDKNWTEKDAKNYLENEIGMIPAPASVYSKQQPKGKHFGRGYYKQTQYANIGFNIPGDTIHQTIGDSGCGPVAAVNALQALGRGTGANDPVIQASSYALSGGFKGKDTGTDPRFFNSYANKYNASAKNIPESNVKSELQKGHPVVLSGEDSNGESDKHPFAEYPHYVTATGYNAKNDTVTIQDPESNYDNQRYKLSNVLRKTTMAKSFSKNKNTYHSRSRKFGRGTEQVPNAQNCEMVKYAEIVAGITGVRSDFILAQLIQESGWDYFKPGTHKDGYNYGNAGGEGGLNTYDYLEEAAYYMANNTIAYGDHRKELAAASQAGDPAAFAKILKDAGYYEDSLEHYTNGITSILNNLKEKGYKVGAINVSGASSSKSAPQNSYGIFDKVFKPFDSLNNSLNGVMSNITKSSGLDKLSKLGTSIFGGLIGGQSPSEGNNSSSSNGNWNSSAATPESIRKASEWAEQVKDHVQDDVNPPYWYGNLGCTAFVNDYLAKAGISPISLNTPQAMEDAKKAGMWKDASQPAYEGDVGIIDTDGNMDEPDHAVIEDGKGGFWSNMSTGHKIAHGSHSNCFEDIWGYIATGAGGGKVNAGGTATDRDKAESGAGKHGPLALRFGRGKSSKNQLNRLGKSINSSNAANKHFGRGIDDLFNSGSLNGSIQNINNFVTRGNQTIANAVSSILPNNSSGNVSNNTYTGQAGIIELLKIAVQLLATISTNTGKNNGVSKEYLQAQQASISSAIASIGQYISASNQSMMNGVSQMILANNGASSEQMHMTQSLTELASI